MTNPTPSKDLIRYDLIVQEALKGVVRKVLIDAGRDGLPGDHHFYISFRTDYPGVRLSQRMRDKYPEEMTIVLQHQFWDLGVTDHTFEVGLSFSGVPERLLIPFDALVGFFDPSVQFGLKFELGGEASEASPAAPVAAERPKLAPPRADKPTPLRGAGSEPAEMKPQEWKASELKSQGAKGQDAKAQDAKPETKSKGKAAKNAEPAADQDADEKQDDKQSAQVVSLDAFRKKT
jgi:hypothetical protein